MTRRILFVFIPITAAILLSGPAICEAAPVVTDIRIEGNERIEVSSILNNMSLKIGDPFSELQVTQSLKNLYRMGAFSRLAITEEPSAEGVAIVVSVIEFPMLVKTGFKGAKSVDETELRKALSVKAFSFADPGKFPDEVEALEEVYSAAGYHGTEISYELEETEKGVIVTYIVRESEKSLIHEIDIIGNRYLDDHVLKKVLVNKEIGPFSFISDSGGYDTSGAEDDLQRIRYMYLEEGFLDVNVKEPVVSVHPEGRGLYVSLTVEEGKQFTLGKVVYSGEWQEPPDHVRREPEIKEGDIFVRSKVMNDLEMYENSYRDVGYAWCRIEPYFDKDPEKGEVVLNLKLIKGPVVKVRWINISGNSKTRGYVIRREMRILEGDLYNQKKLDDSVRFIRRLGFFNIVNITPVKVDDAVADIQVKVEEGSAGTMSAGASYSNTSGLVGTLQLSLGNFSGRGQRLNLSVESGGDSSTYSISFSEPRLFSGVFSFGMDLYDKTNDYSEYSQDSLGGSIRLGYRLSDESSLTGRYRYVTYDVYDIDLDASDSIKEQEGVSTTSSVRLGYTFDTRDFPLDPREGVNLKFSTELAGRFLGGNNSFVRYQAEGSYFKPIIEDLIGMGHLELGYITSLDSEDIPITERYFMGGLHTLRGFEHRKVGPLDEDGEPVGGTKSFLINLEMTYPLIRESKIKGVVFLDAGNVWADDEEVMAEDLRYGAGFGFRWAAPIGLMRLEWGINLDPEPDEEQPGWEFSIGTMF